MHELPATADLVVIGGGVVGAATAFHAARAGLRPVLVEARPALCTLTTPVATGAFRLQFDNPEEIALVRESVELFLHFSDVTGQRQHDPAVRQQGYLWATTSEERAEGQRTLVERQHDWGLTDVEVLDGREVRRRFPFVVPEVIQARFRAGDGFLDPKALTLGLAAASRATVAVDTRVGGFRVEGDRLTGVETSRGAVACERAVVACGPLSGEVARLAGVELPVETVRRHKLVFPELADVPPDAPMTIDDDTGTHWRPFLRGAAVLCTDPSTDPSPPAEEVPLDHSFPYAVLDPKSPLSAARIAPFWRDVWERGPPAWFLQAGQYTMTPDHRPLVGETAVRGLWVNTGYSGHGVMASPAASRILADLMTGRLAAGDNPFRPDRELRRRDIDTL
ncbi:MAG: NAD(P)/FAD-dependent oxidoreductase [Actinomycetota bacterium]